MSDERLRELERRWIETGSVEDETAYLLERVRVGDIDNSRLTLAAYLGSPVAIRVAGTSRENHPTDLELWIYSLHSWEKQVAVRVAIICAEVVIPIVAQALPSRANPQLLISVAKSWLQNQTKHTQSRAYEIADDMGQLVQSLGQIPPSTRYAVKTHMHAALAISAADAVTTATQASQAALAAERANGFVNIRQAIQESLIPWALGYSDPFLERVEARQRHQTGTS